MAAKCGHLQKDWKEELPHLSIKPIEESWGLPTEKEKQMIMYTKELLSAYVKLSISYQQ